MPSLPEGLREMTEGLTFAEGETKGNPKISILTNSTMRINKKGVDEWVKDHKYVSFVSDEHGNPYALFHSADALPEGQRVALTRNKRGDELSGTVTCGVKPMLDALNAKEAIGYELKVNHAEMQITEHATRLPYKLEKTPVKEKKKGK